MTEIEQRIRHLEFRFASLLLLLDKIQAELGQARQALGMVRIGSSQ